MTERVYLDWNATAPLRPQVREAMAAAFDCFGNPSSIHGEGRAARHVVEDARAAVAALVGARPADVVFTSGGTEANELALSPRTTADGRPCDRLLMSAVEHPSVLTGGRFDAQDQELIPVDGNGVVDLPALQHRLRELSAKGIRPLVSVMVANNETGVLQPVSEIAALVHDAGGLLHADAVQAAGKIPLDINVLQADLLVISAHKIGGPKGIGALIRRSDAVHPDALIRGGGQERGLRGGTENVIGIAGFGAAAKAAHAALDHERSGMTELRDHAEAGLRVINPDVAIFGEAVPRLPNTTLFAVPGIKAETAVIGLDLDGVAVSSGSACSSGKVQPSHVLAAMGVAPDLVRGQVRVSLGAATTKADIDRFLEAWRRLSRSLLKTQQVQPGIAA